MWLQSQHSCGLQRAEAGAEDPRAPSWGLPPTLGQRTGKCIHCRQVSYFTPFCASPLLWSPNTYEKNSNPPLAGLSPRGMSLQQVVRGEELGQREKRARTRMRNHVQLERKVPLFSFFSPKDCFAFTSLQWSFLINKRTSVILVCIH